MEKTEETLQQHLYKWPANFLGSSAISLYWLFNVMQRAKTTNFDKIANIWEGDKYQFLTGLLHTRPQDHPMLTDIYLSELVFPNKWFEQNARWLQFPAPCASLPY